MHLPILLILLACGDKDDGTATDDTGTGTAATQREPNAYSQGDCPAIEDGVMESFATGDTDYRVKVVLPPDPQGAPVIFAWHWLGGSSGDLVRTMDLDDLAEDEGVIIIAPDSDGSLYEWHILDPAEGNPDLQLFDDLLRCTWESHGVDLDRVYSLGMSAGGLMTTYVTVHRADWLASTAIFSGGVVEGFYDSPARPIPALVTWGGPSDTYQTFSFDDSSQYFSEQMQADGSFIVECEHSLGHQIPSEGTDMAWQFLNDHPFDVDPEPYVDGLPDTFPSWCRIP